MTAAHLATALRATAQQHADRPAILDRGRVWTYRELDAASDALAAALHRRVPEAGARIALAFRNGADALLASWAVWKAGLVHVPVDCDWPTDRVAAVLHNVAASALLRGPDLMQGTFAMPIWSIEELRDETGAPPPVDESAKALAAIHFTSGSTGIPKGVVLTHRALLHSARNYQRHLSVTAADRYAWTAGFAYGAAPATYLTAHTAGALLMPVRIKETSMHDWVAAMERERITVAMLNASLLRTLLHHLPDGENLPDLRLIKSGGEPLYAEDARLFDRRLHRGCRLINGLGITEAASNVCFFRWDRATPITTAAVPVGFASDDMELLLLDEAGRPVATPGEGEVAVRSPYLADGYWKDPELTRARFAPLDGDPTPVYRTGDFGHLDVQGCLTILGSNQTRLKIRGYRVDAIEVESALSALPGVSEAAIAARTWNNADKIVAWLVGPDTARWHTLFAREALRSKLPDYMIPSLVMSVPALPRLPNGKLDRAALKALPLQIATAPEAGRDTLELQLIRIWELALGVKGIGRSDNFFDLGGDSLNTVTLFSMLQERLGIDLPMLHISDCPTVAAMAERIRNAPALPASPLAVLLEASATPTSFFCIPGGGMDVASLIDLARHLAPAANVYGLQLPGMDGAHAPMDRVEDLARIYLDEIRRIQPAGPYHIGGVSFGGLVAYELAQLLQARGEVVATLALLDTYGPGYPYLRVGLNRFQRWRARWHDFMHERPRRHKENRLRRLLRRARELSNRLRATMWRICGRDPLRLPRELRFDYVGAICRRAFRRYEPKPYFGSVHLFRAMAQRNPELFDTPDDLGWRSCVRGPLIIHPVPGTHAMHFRDPNVSVVAAALIAHLNACGGSHRAIAIRSRAIWEELADWWNHQVGDDGKSMGSRLLEPHVTRLLAPVAGQRILDLGCGNGWYARRLARMGVNVLACDFSARLLQHAQQYANQQGLSIRHHLLDVTSASDWAALDTEPLDAAVSNLALMDMADLSLLFPELARRLKPCAPFVFTIIDPDGEGLSGAGPNQPLVGIGLPNQPLSHFYFHRDLATLSAQAIQAGFRVDTTERVAAKDSREFMNKDFLIVRLLAPE